MGKPDKATRPSPPRTRRVWAAGLLAAAGVHLLGLFLFQASPVTSEKYSPNPGQEVLLVGTDHAASGSGSLLEQALLFDSEPLFLPTGWNTPQAVPIPGLDRRPGDLFAPFAARFSHEEADFGLRALVTDGQVSTPLDLFRHWEDPLVARFGRTDLTPPALPERMARLELMDPAGRVLRTAEVKEGDAPPALRQLWRPVEFAIHVNSLGLLGEPLLLQGSGVEAVDVFLRAAILEHLLHQWMPEPGYYLILGGP